MLFKRLFSGDSFKGTYSYLDTQRKYEIARTILFFAISFGIFIAGYISTGTRKNLLTIVAVLGMLPASKSLVSVIMFCRFKSFKDHIDQKGVLSAYDMVFTSEKVNYHVSHLCVSGGCIIGYTEQKSFNENAFKDHIQAFLSAEKITDMTVKVFTDKKAYLNRIGSLTASDKSDAACMNVLKQIVL
ncbi:MAG: hypothetical protein KBG42_02705 [Lachnospiraceae bacterium]|nr:hypothetical protein [Lachnospiraceae bacterium]